MSNIEPTEEQKQAAQEWQDGVERRVSGRPTLALFLAEREAKLRKQLAFMEAGSLADYNAFAEALQKEDAYLAEINLINERLAEMREVDGRKSRMLYDRDVVIDTLRARIKELEAKANEACRWCAEEDYCDCLGCGGRLPVVCVVGGKCARCGGAEREAQHLADIKALREALEGFLIPVAHTFTFNPGGRARDLLARLAHYDDAKAVEGGEG